MSVPFPIHFGYELEAEALAALRARLDPRIHLTIGELPEPAAYQVLVGGRPTREMLEASPALHTLVIPFAGLPPTTRELLRDFPQIAVHNLHHNAPPTAEMALALLLAVARLLIPADRDLRHNDWSARYTPLPTVLLHGKTALILGYGAIGQHLGQILTAMGMQVLGIRRTLRQQEGNIYPAEALHTLLPRANVLIVALPGTDETSGLLGKHELALLPRGAIVVNIGRAQIIDQYALYDALQSGHLHGAGLDVWFHYPEDEAGRSNTAPADVPFHELDNIVMSPHRGGAGGNPEIELLRMHALSELLNRAASGETLPHRIHLDQGY